MRPRTSPRRSVYLGKLAWPDWQYSIRPKLTALTGLTWFQVYHDLPLCDVYGLQHQALITAGLATDWPQNQATAEHRISTMFARAFNK